MARSKGTRSLIAMWAGWIVCVVTYTILAEPFGSSMSGGEREDLMAWLFIPPAALTCLLLLARWAWRSPANPHAATAEPATPIDPLGLEAAIQTLARCLLAYEEARNRGLTDPGDAMIAVQMREHLKALEDAVAKLRRGGLSEDELAETAAAYKAAVSAADGEERARAWTRMTA